MRALLLIGMCAVLSAQAPDRRVVPDGALLASSEGGGTVRLLVWLPIRTPYPPGGWQVQDATGKVLVPTLKAGDPEALKGLSAEEAVHASRMHGEILAEQDAGRRRMLALNALVEAGYRPALGRAMGLACTLAAQPAGVRTYRVVGLDGAGKAAGPTLVSAAIDPGGVSPLPGAPTALRAEAAKDAVRLFWTPVDGGAIPVLDYRIQRGEQLLTARPNILGVWDPARPAFEDREAPGDQTHEYRVWAVDVFGRGGPDSAVGVFFPDPATLRPPTDLTPTAEPGTNVLSFRPSPTRRSAGILVERAFVPEGPFELITPTPLVPTATRFNDDPVGGGVTYHYRLRVVDADGNVGDPGAARAVIARSKGRPPAPVGLRVELGPLGNTLTWTVPEVPLAGFLVERRTEAGVWTRLGQGLVQGGTLVDRLTDDVSGVLSYRVSAFTRDNLASEPCEPVQVVRDNLAPPPPPVLQGVDGSDGKVRLRFRAAAPEGRSAQLLVLRSLRHRDEQRADRYGLELVVGEPLAGTSREFTDTWVDPGETYRYRLVAVSPEGIRSAFAAGVETRVSPPPLPEPPVPALQILETPFRCVQVKLPSLPEGFRAFLHRKAPGERVWTEIQGPFQTLEVVDPRPVRGRVQYRIHLEDAAGLTGRSGQPVVVEIP